ncbi:MAG: succinylglutamate desuccinylase/aspartoacylase family protein [bacterium]|nr:succinylglutamate desuccinylase/aspartoacylase family protein [bacterium]
MEKITEDFVRLVGNKPGPTSVILGGVHGDEICGPDAILRVLPDLRIEKGNVLFGFGNPPAIEKRERFLGANLNRMFADNLSPEDMISYEYQRAQFMKRYLDEADILLDIHASTNPQSRPFCICESNACNIVQYLPVELVVSGFDEVEPGGTDYYMNKIGKIGICIECGYREKLESVDLAEQAIKVFLGVAGHIGASFQRQPQKYIKMYRLYKTKTDNFVLAREFGDFEELQAGQLIGTDGLEEIHTDRESVILFPKNKEKEGEEAFLLGEVRHFA